MKTKDAHLILQPEEPRPSAEDERVVSSDDRDDVDALRLELVVLLEERREVVHVARRLRICACIGLIFSFKRTLRRNAP